MANRETTKQKLERAISHIEKAHENDRSFYDALYGAGIEKGDVQDIAMFLASRIEDQYYSSAPSQETQAFIHRLRRIAAEIESYIY